MSGFSASVSTGLLDQSGNINTIRLSQELTAALDFDIKYKQVDNMKKRAVRNAGSYDEFRQLVAAAHLKKVSRKEVESLSDVKRGWTKGSTGKHGTESALLDLQDENNSPDSLKNRPESLIPAKKAKKVSSKKSISASPKTSMELDRNLRRFSCDTDRFAYISSLSRDIVMPLLVKAIDVDLMENIWRLSFFEENPQETLYWLSDLSTLPKFEMMLMLSDDSLKEKTMSFLSSMVEVNTSEISIEDLVIAFSEKKKQNDISAGNILSNGEDITQTSQSEEEEPEDDESENESDNEED